MISRNLHLVRQIVCFAVMLVLLWVSPARGDLVWPEDTEGQRQLKLYVAQADEFLQEQGEQPVNSLFESYRSFAVFGITDAMDAETPEGVEITARLYPEMINTLELRVSYIPRFPQIAAAFIRALTPESLTMSEARKVPEAWAKKALNDPGTSWEEEVETLNGTMPYIYYSYYPNQFHDGVNWIQMTIVFPMAEYWDGSSLMDGQLVTPGPKNYGENPADYDGYDPGDDYEHYEFFVTPTPEPDSPAGDPYSQP